MPDNIYSSDPEFFKIHICIPTYVLTYYVSNFYVLFIKVHIF